MTMYKHISRQDHRSLEANDALHKLVSGYRALKKRIGTRSVVASKTTMS